jgi:hypothetical protein
MICPYCGATISGMSDSRIVKSNRERLIVCRYADDCNRRKAIREGRLVPAPAPVVAIPRRGL